MDVYRENDELPICSHELLMRKFEVLPLFHQNVKRANAIRLVFFLGATGMCSMTDIKLAI